LELKTVIDSTTFLSSKPVLKLNVIILPTKLTHTVIFNEVKF